MDFVRGNHSLAVEIRQSGSFLSVGVHAIVVGAETNVGASTGLFILEHLFEAVGGVFHPGFVNSFTGIFHAFRSGDQVRFRAQTHHFLSLEFHFEKPRASLV